MATEIINLSDFTKDTPVSIETSEQTIQISVATALQWVAPGAPNNEVLKFLLTCRTAKLNPFLNEAYLIQMGGKWGTIIAKAGYLKRAQQHPDYDGHESGIVLQAFKTVNGKPEKHGPLIEQVGEIVPGGHLLVGGWARIWKKGLSRPIHGQVSFSEYDKGTATWKSIPCTMIRKVALVSVIREAFAIGDSYDESEFDGHSKVKATHQPAVHPHAGIAGPSGSPGSPGGVPQLEAIYRQSEDPSLGPRQAARIRQLAEQVGWTEARLEQVLVARGVYDVADLSPADANILITKLEEIVSRREFVENFPNPPAAQPTVAYSSDANLELETTGPPASSGRDSEPSDGTAEYVIPDVVRQSGKKPEQEPVNA